MSNIVRCLFVAMNACFVVHCLFYCKFSHFIVEDLSSSRRVMLFCFKFMVLCFIVCKIVTFVTGKLFVELFDKFCS